MNVSAAMFVVALGCAVASAAARADDAADGEKVFKTNCAICHIATADGARRLGPSLFNVVGRHSGAIDGFRYSAANKKADLTWTPEVLDRYLADPKAVVPGTIMAFAGVRNADQRRQLIAYLQTLK
jgi:cytochrome c